MAGGEKMVLEPVFKVIAKGFQTMTLLSQEFFSVTKLCIASRRDQRMYLHSEHGFTIIELIVIMALIGIMLAVASLNMTGWRANMYLKTTAREVVSSFQLARVEAAKRNATASIQLTKGGAGVGKCEVVISGQTIKEVDMPPSVQVTALEQPVGTVVAGSNATYQVNNRGFPVGAAGKITLSNGTRNYDVELKPAGGVTLTGP
jgi:prepilin-type N-terminal cleavage/methylation domain-containing protein